MLDREVPVHYFPGHLQFACRVPPGAVHQQYAVRLSGDVFADLIEMQLHGMGIGPRQHESCSCTAGRTDGAEQIG